MKIELKKKLLVAALVPAFGLPLAGTAIAQADDARRGENARQQQSQPSSQSQQRQQQGEQGQKQRQNQQVRDMRASDIIGATVRDKQGETLGDVQDLIVDVGNEKVSYAVLAFGGFLGFGEKLFAYPMDRFQAAGDDGDELMLSVSEQELKNAPGFDRSNWPTFGAAGGYRGEVDKHFGQTVQTGGDLVRMSELLSQDIKDRSGNDVGQVDDIVVSVTDGQIRYLVMEPDNNLDMGDRLVMLPLNALQASAEQQQQQQQRAEGQQPGQPQDRTVATGDSGTSGARSGTSSGTSSDASSGSGSGASGQQARNGEDRQQAQQQQREQARERDLQLVLQVEPKQLRNARSFESNQWPDLNNPSFQREMDNYSASFGSGAGAQATGSSQQRSSATGNGARQGSSGDGASGSSGAGASDKDKPKSN